jgi:hypothetical protein
MPFVVEGGQVRNGYLLRTNNKLERDETLTLEVKPANAAATVTLPQQTWQVPAGQQGALPFFVAVPQSSFAGRFEVVVKVTTAKGTSQELKAPFLGPER